MSNEKKGIVIDDVFEDDDVVYFYITPAIKNRES